jgi:hypothetical protein
MSIRCCNSDCQAPFNYMEGRLVRFSSQHDAANPSENTPLIQHFWLCGKCTVIFKLEWESGTTVRLRPRDRSFYLVIS